MPPLHWSHWSGSQCASRFQDKVQDLGLGPVCCSRCLSAFAADKVTCCTASRMGREGPPSLSCALVWAPPGTAHACACIPGSLPCRASPSRCYNSWLDEGLPGYRGGGISRGGRSAPPRGGPGRGGLARSSFFQLNIVACAFIRLGFLHHVTVLSLPAGSRSE